MTAWPSVGRIRWGWFLLATAILVLLPLATDTHTPTLLLIWALFALSLGMMWGYAGLLSFGHAAYFGLGAYTYAVAVVNIGESTLPLILAMAVPAAVAAVIGAMMFFGRISDVYMGVITLVVTLILFKFMSARPAINTPSAMRGCGNGMPGFPSSTSRPAGSRCWLPITTSPRCRCSVISSPLILALFKARPVGIRENGALRAARLQRAATRPPSSPSARRWPGSPAACSPTGPRSSRPAYSR
jgi:branched-chain amino acid transport system permease protein